MNLYRLLRLPGCVLLGCSSLLASAAQLGDPAPPLQVAEWVKGGPVSLADGKGKTVYVVEFWATWCPPCRTSIPHLTELQKKFKAKGVVFVGITDEAVDVVKPFVTKQGDKMDYAVGVDRDGKTGTAYMKAFGIDGIPHAFVVDTAGRIVWDGHPMAELEQTIESVLAGKHDIERSKKRGQASEMLKEFYTLAGSGKDEARLTELGKELAALDTELGGLFPGEKFDAEKLRKNARFSQALRAYQQAAFEGQNDDAIETLAAKAEPLAPAGFDFPDFRRTMGLQKLYRRYLKVVGDPVDEAKATELARQMSESDCKNPLLLNDIAWTLLTDERVKKRDVALAARLAKVALDATKEEDPNVLDTYARALFDSGKSAEAVTYQKKAIAASKEADAQIQMEESLKRYEKALAAR